MSKTTILDNEYATLWYYPESQIVHHQFHKFIHGEALRDILCKGLEIAQHDGVEKWLSDDRSNSSLPQVDYDWATENWITPMMDAGWKYWAMILPEKSVGRATMERILQDYAGRGLTIKVFDTPEEAYEWLASV